MTADQKSEQNEHSKAKKTIGKAIKDIRSRHPNVIIDQITPKNAIFIVHSSFCCAGTFPNIQEFINSIDANHSLFVFPQQKINYKEYILVEFEDVNKAKHFFDVVNDSRPQWVGGGNTPVHCLYASNFDFKREEAPLQGFNVTPNFITKEKSEELKNFVNSCKPSEVLKNRTVIHFGHVFDYGTNTAFSATTEIPPILSSLVDELKKSLPIEVDPDQITINVYEPGQGIPSHVDTHSAFEDQIIVISLLSDVVIRFRDCANSATTIEKLVPKNSVLIMEDVARYKYKHCILTRGYDISPTDNKLLERKKRISITFRKVRNIPCNCKYPEFCDWDRNGTLAFPKEDTEAEILETKYVSQVYEDIADHFDITRFSLWPGFVEFMKSLPKWSLVLDAGCGNGKYLAADFNLIRIGSDLCENLLKISARKGFSVFRSNLLELPVKNETFDGVICAAVVHHFSTVERRLRAFKEIARVLRKGGRALVSGWSKEQGDSFYQKMRANREEEETTELPDSNSSTDKLVVHDGTIFTQQDMLVPWDCNKKQDGKQFLRYYHLFIEGEMEKLVEQLEDCKLIKSFLQQGNWFIEFEKF